MSISHDLEVSHVPTGYRVVKVLRTHQNGRRSYSLFSAFCREFKAIVPRPVIDTSWGDGTMSTIDGY
jgi:hypothetical protein